MKRKIRYNAFETNSSSTHAICISKKNKIDSLNDNAYKKYHKIPLIFKLDDYDWDFDIIKTPEEKASYLYTALFCLYRKSNALKIYLNVLGMFLSKYDIKYKFIVSQEQMNELDDLIDFYYDEHIKYDITTNEEDYLWYRVDHYENLIAFVPDILFDEIRLLNYLFGDSFIVIGNDNDSDFETYMCKSDGEYDFSEYHDEWKDEFKRYDIFYKGC